MSYFKSNYLKLPIRSILFKSWRGTNDNIVKKLNAKRGYNNLSMYKYNE